MLGARRSCCCYFFDVPASKLWPRPSIGIYHCATRHRMFGDANTPVPNDAGLNVQLRALGNYAHPPVTKDITGKVTWASNTPGVATVDATGLLVATGTDCGNAVVSATVQNNTDGNETASGAIVTGSMTATVVCFQSMDQPPAQSLPSTARGPARRPSKDYQALRISILRAQGF